MEDINWHTNVNHNPEIANLRRRIKVSMVIAILLIVLLIVTAVLTVVMDIITTGMNNFVIVMICAVVLSFCFALIIIFLLDAAEQKKRLNEMLIERTSITN